MYILLKYSGVCAHTQALALNAVYTSTQHTHNSCGLGVYDFSAGISI